MSELIQYITDPANTFADHTRDTILLCLVPIALALLIALPLGVLVARRPITAFLAANVSGLIRAIPTLAVLFVMVLFLKQIGFTPSVIALTALGVPPILLNVIAGLRSVDPAAIDAARGMGMTRLQVLARVELPLVLPVAAAGVRSAAVQIVATVPLAALIGGGGYGDYILKGLADEVHATDLFVGAFSVALLALLTEAIFALAQRAVTPAGLRAGLQAAGAGAVIGPTEAEAPREKAA